MTTAAITSETDDLWQAVIDRDESQIGRFVFGVRTTGIYCRPGCPARQPHRENVEFFARATEAESSGFRACRRCYPSAPVLRDRHIETVRWVCAHLDNHRDENPSLEELSRVAGVSPWHLQRIFKKLLGISPREYQQAKRLGTFKKLLRDNNVLDSLLDAGYGSTSRVYENGRSSLGMTPATYRRGGKGATIEYAVVSCPFGKMLVGATDQGICKISLGDHVRELEEGLKEEFPLATIRHDTQGISPLAEQVLNLLEGKIPHDDLPLDIRATAFQWRVWSFLKQIPRGETRSYGEVAAALGQPTAARAVARACASNPVPLAIPCHRVIQGNGGLGGYRYGTDRKEKILEKERKTS